MGNVKGGTNCTRCVDCQRMIGDGVSWRCYGDDGYGEMKKDICKGDAPPRIAPSWCPNRKRKVKNV